MKTENTKIEQSRIGRLNRWNKAVKQVLDMHNSDDQVAINLACDNMLRKARLLTALIDEPYSRVQIEQITAEVFYKFYDKNTFNYQ